MFARATLYGLPVWIVFLAAAGSLVLVTELGFRGGRRLGRAAQERAKFETGSIQASVLGLLALLLGFTYSASMSNFQERRTLVVKEANAIGTAYLRAQLLQKPLAQQAGLLLRRYTDLHLQWAAATETEAARIARQGDEVQKEIWAIAARAAEQDRGPVTALFISSVNDLIDVGGERVASNSNRLPIQMFGLLGVLALVGMGLTGYGCGLSGERSFAATTTVSLLIVALTLVICDIHEPRQGLIHESQQSLIDARAAMP
ncbi:hypothetical protein [Methylocapsa palsarum]|jgi:hypothetical protein|uniref:DUF4239 domain-containing protein n=1 Tax=Methylocapsa palsarum TaxID=1612308 RepID=A0A1I3Z421_9HYPH|nr:hypothetical protein [Methylocapsa palsarum]SFK38818.1 hypothetical protein SAMN05444581_10759 [Methylocapsa palsarum]